MAKEWDGTRNPFDASPAALTDAQILDCLGEVRWSNNGAWCIDRIRALLAASPADQMEDARDAAAYRRLNTPEIADFLTAVHNEALHQRERWGASGDAGKSDADWFWLIGYLAGKGMRAESVEKLLHHIITTAAACLNWHSARIGYYVDMRPGIDGDAAMGASK